MMQMGAAMTDLPGWTPDAGHRGTLMLHRFAASRRWTMEPWSSWPSSRTCRRCARYHPQGRWIQKREMAATMCCLQSEAAAWKWMLHLAATSSSHVCVERVWQHWQLGLDEATPLHAESQE